MPCPSPAPALKPGVVAESGRALTALVARFGTMLRGNWPSKEREVAPNLMAAFGVGSRTAVEICR